MKDIQHTIKYQRLTVPVLSVIIIVLVFGLGFVLGRSGFNIAWRDGEISYSVKGQLYPEDKEIDFTTFWEVWSLLEGKYVERELEKESMVYGAVKGMVSALDDPATRFFTPDETDEYEYERGGMLQGIGIEMGYMDNNIVIKRLIENAPALTSGLKPGDIIYKVDNESLEDLTISEVAGKIRGEKGTDVLLTVLRGKNTDELSFTITRDEVYVPSIEWEKLEEGIIVVSIRRFTEESLTDFMFLWDKIAGEIASESPSGVIIDVRGNGGGFLDGAVHVAGDFLDKGDVVVYIQDREEKLTAKSVTKKGVLGDVPVVILVDGGTASSSEIFAGALRYYERTSIIGEETYGKGTAQDVIKPEEWDGASIHVTTQKWLLPNKEWISRETPIIPDIIVELTLEQIKKGDDPQLERAKEEVKNSF